MACSKHLSGAPSTNIGLLSSIVKAAGDSSMSSSSARVSAAMQGESPSLLFGGHPRSAGVPRVPVGHSGAGESSLPVTNSSKTPFFEGEWPLPGSIPARKGANWRLTMALMNPCSDKQGESSYHPTTKREKLWERINLADEIRKHLFSKEEDSMLADLDDTCCRLEAFMGRMMLIQWGSAIMQQGQLNPGVGWEVGDDMVQIDVRFDHSWTPGGFEPGLGWYWIPKGTLLMDTYYLAR